MSLLHGAEVCADGHLHHVGEADGLHGSLDLGGGGVLAELAHKSGCHAGDDLLLTHHSGDDLEDLAFVGDGGEGAVDKAHAAGDALVIVDLGAAVLIGLDGVHAAGGGAGTVDLGDGAVGALVEALAALDALLLIDVALLVLIQIDGIHGTDIHAGVRIAALAAVGDADVLGGAGIAGIGNDVDQRLFKILLVDGSLLNVGADAGRVIRALQTHAQSQTQTGADDGTLQKNIVAVVTHFAVAKLVGDHVHPLVIAALIGKGSHFLEYAAANIVHNAVYASHICSSVKSRVLVGICLRNRRHYYKGLVPVLQENFCVFSVFSLLFDSFCGNFSCISAFSHIMEPCRPAFWIDGSIQYGIIIPYMKFS